MFIARGLCARPVFRFLERGFLRIRRIWITRWTLLLYSLKSQSGLLPESTTHPMYLLLLMTSSYLLQEKPESPHFSNSLCHCALRQILQSTVYLGISRLVKCRKPWKLDLELLSYTQRLTYEDNNKTLAGCQKHTRMTRIVWQLLKMSKYPYDNKSLYNLLTKVNLFFSLLFVKFRLSLSRGKGILKILRQLTQIQNYRTLAKM